MYHMFLERTGKMASHSVKLVKNLNEFGQKKANITIIVTMAQEPISVLVPVNKLKVPEKVLEKLPKVEMSPTDTRLQDGVTIQTE